jgi:hypothetical protein
MRWLAFWLLPRGRVVWRIMLRYWPQIKTFCTPLSGLRRQKTGTHRAYSPSHLLAYSYSPIAEVCLCPRLVESTQTSFELKQRV